jgi:predicted nucleic acid-binding protein
VSNGSRGPVIVDTGVFGARLTPRGRPLAAAYRPLLEGRPALISFITVAELRYGASLAGWGPGRLARLDRELARVDTVWPGPNLTGTYVTLRTWCAKTGHGLGGKDHEADRWVAASAIWLDISLVAHDAIFANVKDLTLLTKLDL